MTILCYGDSNTYGYDGTDPLGARLPENARWPELLAKTLGCACVNCGLNGRRVPRYPRQLQTDLNLLRRSRGCELILVMLGTNDILLGAEPEDVADCMRAFLEKHMQAMPDSAILLCAPPPVPGFEGFFSALAEAYAALARDLGILYTDTSNWQIPMTGDGVHFSVQGHRLFALRMGRTLRTLLG